MIVVTAQHAAHGSLQCGVRQQTWQGGEGEGSRGVAAAQPPKSHPFTPPISAAVKLTTAAPHNAISHKRV